MRMIECRTCHRTRAIDKEDDLAERVVIRGELRVKREHHRMGDGRGGRGGGRHGLGDGDAGTRSDGIVKS